ncbi:hypothetical protein ACTJKK_02395 [Microbacterium sp. 22179]|uniref:hypothetical protein n=1 Tax=Microbacterium sp. 22179 TaxID=3453886 RepID=UPI003F868E02
MNALSSPETLPEQAFAPQKSPLDHYNDMFWELQNEPELGVTPHTLMLELPAVAIATLEVRQDLSKPCVPTTRGLVTEAAMRVGIWHARARELSAWETALNFQYLYFRGTGDRGGKVPRLGLDLLRCVDELSCDTLELWVTMPRDCDPYQFEDVRLRDAIARVACSTRV